MVMDDGLYREPDKHRVPFGKQQRVPQPTCPAIAVGKGVDQFKLVVEHTALDQYREFTAFDPFQQICDCLRHVLGQRSEVDDLPRLIDHAHGPGAELSGLLFQARHHDSVDCQKVIYGIGVQCLQSLVDLKGVAHLRDILGRSQHPLAIQDCGDLVHCQRVLLNGQGAIDGSDPVTSTQGRVGKKTVYIGHPAHQLRDLCHIGNHSIRQFKRRVFAHILPLSAMVIVSGPFLHIPGTIGKLLNP